MSASKIEWTEETWNPVTGCTQISNGCKNCYAKRMTKRLQSMGLKKYENGFKVTVHYDSLNEISHLKKPRMIFVCSMSDLFHEDVPEDFIMSVFEIMNKNQQHIFQVLTKRPGRVAKMNEKLKWTKNIWFGVTIEDNNNYDRLKYLKHISANLKFLSCEPLLSSINDIPLENVDWVIVGGESGPKCRVCKKEWVEEIQKKCEENNITFFFKQWGGTNKKKTGSLLNGKYYKEYPSK